MCGIFVTQPRPRPFLRPPGVKARLEKPASQAGPKKKPVSHFTPPRVPEDPKIRPAKANIQCFYLQKKFPAPAAPGFPLPPWGVPAKTQPAGPKKTSQPPPLPGVSPLLKTSLVGTLVGNFGCGIAWHHARHSIIQTKLMQYRRVQMLDVQRILNGA